MFHISQKVIFLSVDFTVYPESG